MSSMGPHRWPYGSCFDINPIRSIDLNYSKPDFLLPGIYTCEASSRVATDTREIYITVLVRPRITADFQRNRVAVEGDKAELECRAEGSPKPTIRWEVSRRSSAKLEDTVFALCIARKKLGLAIEVKEQRKRTDRCPLPHPR